MAQLGKFDTLVIVRDSDHGHYLDGGELGDILLPTREVPEGVEQGDEVEVFISCDSEDRIVATMRTNKFLSKAMPQFQVGEKVPIIIADRSPLGFNAIVAQRYRGLIRETTLKRPIRIGETMDAWIADMRVDGNIDLSLEEIGYGRVKSLTEKIMSELEDNGGTLALGDKSSPEAIQNLFGTSKKAFKQALGALYRQKKITMTGNGIEQVK